MKLSPTLSKPLCMSLMYLNPTAICFYLLFSWFSKSICDWKDKLIDLRVYTLRVWLKSFQFAYLATYSINTKCMANSFIIELWAGLGLLTFIIVCISLTDWLSLFLMIHLHAAMLLFLSCRCDIPGLINCHPPLFSAIRKAGKWLLFPPVSWFFLASCSLLNWHFTH